MRALCWILGGLSVGLSACRGCGEESSNKSVAPGPSSSAFVEASEGGASPFFLVLSSGSEFSFSGFWGGVWIGTPSRVAQAIGQRDLTSGDMPPGLPEGEGRVNKVMGRLPGSVWLSFARLGEGAKVESEPLFKLMNGGMKKVADDWRPHLVAWSGRRILALSTSSGRLKIKVMEPFSEKPPADMPGAWLKDESCSKTLKVHGAVALSKGDVLAAGNCRPEGAQGMRYVLLRWAAPPVENAEKAAPSAPSAAGTAHPEDAWPVASAEASPDGGMGGSAEEKRGLPPDVLQMPNVSKNMLHKTIVTDGNLNVLMLAHENASSDGGGAKAHVYRLEGEGIKEEVLPQGDELLKAVAAEPDGTLWGVGNRIVLKRAAQGTWEEVKLPRPSGEIELDGVWASGERDIWVWGHSAAKGEHLVFRLKAPANQIRW